MCSPLDLVLNLFLSKQCGTCLKLFRCLKCFPRVITDPPWIHQCINSVSIAFPPTETAIFISGNQGATPRVIPPGFWPEEIRTFSLRFFSLNWVPAAENSAIDLHPGPLEGNIEYATSLWISVSASTIILRTRCHSTRSTLFATHGLIQTLQLKPHSRSSSFKLRANIWRTGAGRRERRKSPQDKYLHELLPIYHATRPLMFLTDVDIIYDPSFFSWWPTSLEPNRPRPTPSSQNCSRLTIEGNHNANHP